MAAMNILSQPWSPTASLSLYYFNNHNHYNISNYKLHSFSHPDNFSLPSSLCAPTKSNHTASRLSQMPTHLSKSGALSYFSFNFLYFGCFFSFFKYLYMFSYTLTLFGCSEKYGKTTKNILKILIICHLFLWAVKKSENLWFNKQNMYWVQLGKRLWNSEFQFLCKRYCRTIVCWYNGQKKHNCLL